MEITTVRVSYGRTVNMGNYESLRLEYQAEANLSPGENAEDVIQHLRKNLRADIETGIGKEMAFLHGQLTPNRRG